MGSLPFAASSFSCFLRTLRYTLVMESQGLQHIGRIRWLLAAIFLSERIILYSVGLRCQLEGLSWYWQLLDTELLKHKLLESLLNLHAQPPLFNLLTGLLLKTGAGLWIFSLFCTLQGLLMCLILFEIFSDFGWQPRNSLLLITLIAIQPAWLLYEQWFFYDFPTALLLALATLSLLRWGKKAHAGYLLFYLGSLTALAGLRSIFHILWLVPAIALAILARKPVSRRLRAALLIPLLLVGGWYLKNLMLFGFFGSSSWMGLSLAKMTTTRLPPEDALELVNRGILSEFALLHKPFAPLEDYEKISGLKFKDPENPALGTRETRSGGRNYNHLAYIGISSTCRHDALEVIRRRPEIYFDAIRIAVHCFFGPVSAYPAFRDNLEVLAPIAKLEIFGWDLPPVSTILFLFGFLSLIYLTIRAIKSGDGPSAAIFIFALYCIVWVFITGNMLEIGENERFRWVLSPLLFLVIAAFPHLRRQFRRPSPRVQQESRDSSAPPASKESE